MQNIISKAVDFFAKSNFDWSICGGDAIDFFIGKTTRKHKDLDLSVFWEDRNKTISFMLNAGWRVFEACGEGKIQELYEISEFLVKRNIFCFPNSNSNCQLQPTEKDNVFQFTLANDEQIDFDYVEFLFNQRDDEKFYFSSNHSIKRSLDKAILDKAGVKFLSPEIVLLYKSTYLDTKDAKNHRHDFEMSLPYLSLEQKEWLKNALGVCHSSNHEWISSL
ncbi:hypothetical protein KHA93_05470 [Bacillus sp. FJAT-49732]|uniref:Uncharacterized protein n=1 Tax=Lederbergia citrisecunda TaxID=2833583 RepID=A0A942TJ60_9BACI|nr:hypothetical protein [Lederbergia citrisecunda]MBS4199106.1 hypothetical protein [Lederbergia citrisecunda]